MNVTSSTKGYICEVRIRSDSYVHFLDIVNLNNMNSMKFHKVLLIV